MIPGPTARPARRPSPLRSCFRRARSWAAAAGLLLGAFAAGAGLAGDRYEEARRERSVEAARPQMERILADGRNPAAAAKAALWLGQHAYALGEIEPALGYVERALELAPEEGDLRDRALFWGAHLAGLLGLPPPGAGTLSAGTHAVGRDLAGGDAEVRAGDPRAAMRRYLEIEGSARDAGWLGPLAFRAALVADAARSAGESDALFDLGGIRRWDAELRMAPERGLVARRVRGVERAAPAPSSSASEFAATGAGTDGDTDRQWGEAETALHAEGSSPAVAPEASPPRTDREPAPADEGAGGLFVIQLGAFRDRDAARTEMERLTARGLSVRLERGVDAAGERVYRIRLGGPQTREDARRLAERLLGGFDYQLVPAEP